MNITAGPWHSSMDNVEGHLIPLAIDGELDVIEPRRQLPVQRLPPIVCSW